METMKGTYSIHIGGYDWGASVNEVLLQFNKPLQTLSKEDILVEETKQATDYTKFPEFPINVITVKRTILDAYLCDESKHQVEGESNYALLKLYVSPEEGNPLIFSMHTQLNTYSKPYYLTFTSLNNNVEFDIEKQYTSKTTDADMMKVDSYQTSSIKYDYGYYIPNKETETLFVWLHGIGEGGIEDTDPYITALANKVTAYFKPEFQDTFDGVHVLIPQCPTYWMDNDGKKTNFSNRLIGADGTSYYTESLKELIDMYKEKVGAKKVVVAGCSNGGYMTLLLAMTYPDAFDAIVPICEAIPDSTISDKQIQALLDVPMYFIYSEDDKTVDPTIHEIPTIKRLKEANAKELHVSTTKHVIDTSGLYKDKDGQPYLYNGHWSWIYFDNNECISDTCKDTVWTWMAKHTK